MKASIKRFLIISVLLTVIMGSGIKMNAYGGLTESMFDNAARKGSTLFLRVLLFFGAGPRIKNHALAVAMANKQKAAASLMLKKGADINGEYLGKNPIHFAVNSPEMTELALEHGADCKARDINGMTPLMWWAKGENGPESAELLLKREAGTFARDKEGSTAMLHAILEGNTPAVAFLLNHGADTKAENQMGLKPIIAAAVAGDANMLRLLLKNNVPVNDSNLNGETAFMSAIATGKLENARILHDEGKANIRAITRQRFDALGVATQLENVPAIQLCIELGLDPFKPANTVGWTAYDIAKRSGNKDILQFFDNMKK